MTRDKYRFQMDLTLGEKCSWDMLTQEIEIGRPEMVRHAVRMYSYLTQKVKRGEGINLLPEDLKVMLKL
jgi:hypothetical protein